MGFIKMFKKDKDVSGQAGLGQNLDVPPAPTQQGSAEGDLFSKDITAQASSQALSSIEVPNPPQGAKSLPTDDFEVPPPPTLPTAPAVPVVAHIPVAKSVAPAPTPTPAKSTSTYGSSSQFDRLIGREEKSELRELRTHEHYAKPIFVEVDDYRKVLDYVAGIKTDIKDSENILTRLQDIKTSKEKEFEKWRNFLEDVERKLLYVDKTLFEEQ